LAEAPELPGTSVAQRILVAWPPPPELKCSGENVGENAVQLLKVAHPYLDWAYKPYPKGEHEIFALRGAALIYAVAAAAADQPDRPWPAVHDYAFSVFEDVLGQVLGEKNLELDRVGPKLGAELFRLAISAARSVVPSSDPEDTPEVLALLGLMEKFRRFLRR
jgi:hypothetical protein